jgi:acetylornithine deacetylase
MDVFALTRALVDIPSTTNQEEAAGAFVADCLERLVERFGGYVERMAVEPHRFNVFAQFGENVLGKRAGKHRSAGGETPIVTLSTHLDTVPPFFPSREDQTHIWGRGACDAKGILAAMVSAAEALLEAGEARFALLFVVGEERNSAGAYVAARQPRGSRFLINGEPTDNRLALASKGALRYELIASGRMAHSAYPELGDSAVHKLIDALAEVRRIALPCDPLLGPSTLNIGTISGGRAPNVIADEARAEVMIRLVGDSSETKSALARAIAGRAELKEIIEVPALRLNALDGLPTTVAAFTTDIPAFAGNWGQPFLIGPGSIQVAHTLEEQVSKQQLTEAVAIYQRMVRNLCKRESQ